MQTVRYLPWSVYEDEYQAAILIEDAAGVLFHSILPEHGFVVVRLAFQGESILAGGIFAHTCND